MRMRTKIAGERVTLVAPSAALAAAVLSFHERNKEHLGPWTPALPAGFWEVEYHEGRLSSAQKNFEEDVAWRWSIMLGTEYIGHIHFSQIHRGCFMSCMLGYGLDHAHEGRGLMREALQLGIAEVFSERGRLHRIQANVQPSNVRSLGLLKRLGFADEGEAPSYLYMNGAWRNHVMTALLNPDFREEWLD